MTKNEKILFTTDEVDDAMFMGSDLHLVKTFKDGLKVHFEGQQGGNVTFTIYRKGIEDLNKFLTKWLEEDK